MFNFTSIAESTRSYRPGVPLVVGQAEDELSPIAIATLASVAVTDLGFDIGFDTPGPAGTWFISSQIKCGTSHDSQPSASTGSAGMNRR